MSSAPPAARRAGAAASFDRINYAVRPAKATQRHMIVELIGRLTPFGRLSDYTYIGFGSTYFVDFKLVHQRFGMKRMFSIEREIASQKRFELNKPLSCITLLFGDSRSKLLDRRIGWSSGPAIVWLDYDEPLDGSKLADLERVLRHCVHGSLILVTVCAEAGKIKGRRERWSEKLGPLLPYSDTDNTLDDERVREICLDALQDRAGDVISHRAGAWSVSQVLRMGYKDGAAMATWAGLVTDGAVPSPRRTFRGLPFVRTAGQDTYVLEVPNLTPTERALVESKLPTGIRGARGALRRNAIPEIEADRLLAVYRHAPRFVETFA